MHGIRARGRLAAVPSRRPATVALALLVTLALLATACSGSSSGRARAATKANGGPAPASTAWGKVLARIGPDGTVDRQTALQAFALAFGPVPGVRVPNGPKGRVTSGSEALRWAVRFRDEMTPAQQGAVDRVVHAGDLGTAGPGKAAPRVDGLGTARYRTLVDEMLSRYKGPLGALPIATSVARVGFLGTAWAYADGYDANGDQQGPAVRCFVGITPIGQKGSDDALAQTLAHELFHCYQHAWSGTLARMYHEVEVAPWAIEGSATWAGINVAPVQIAPADNWWIPYLTSPTQSLFSREHDGVGFYGQVYQQGVDLWPLFRKFISTSGNVARYHVLADPAGDKFADAWAPGYFRRPARGNAWEITGKAVPPAGTLEPPVVDLTIGNGTQQAVSAKPFTNGLYAVDASADITHVAIARHARLADAAGFDSTELSDLYLCTKADGNCACPDQSEGDGSAGLPPSRQTVKGVLTLGLTGATDGAQGAVSGQSLDEFCKPRKKKQPSGSALRPCQVITPADAIRLVPGLANQTPHETIYNANQSGLCVYAPESSAGPLAAIDAQIYHRPAGAPIDQDYTMIAALCTEQLPGIGRRAGIGTRDNGLFGCVLAGTTIVTIAAVGATHESMVATLRSIARRL